MKDLRPRPQVSPKVFWGALFVLLALFFMSGLCWAEDKNFAGQTRIRSQKMSYSHKQGKVEFTGKVHVSRPDMQIWSEKLTIFFSESGEDKDGQSAAQGFGQADVQKIVAEDSVRIEQEDRVGECQTAVYQVQEEILRLEGDPVLKEGKNQISGKVIKLYLKENRSEIIGGEQGQVEALFFTPEEQQEEELIR
jgi:lipopolysaccharide export system protein LptA